MGHLSCITGKTQAEEALSSKGRQFVELKDTLAGGQGLLVPWKGSGTYPRSAYFWTAPAVLLKGLSLAMGQADPATPCPLEASRKRNQGLIGGKLKMELPEQGLGYH